MNSEIPVLAAAAFGLGAVHTALGPDHYLPFLALGRSRGWSGRRTLGVALGCGTAHVASSVALGLGGFLGGRALADLTAVDRLRGSLAGWLLYLSEGALLPLALTILGVLVIWRHRTNIQRLLAGTENRFERKSKQPQQTNSNS